VAFLACNAPADVVEPTPFVTPFIPTEDLDPEPATPAPLPTVETPEEVWRVVYTREGALWLVEEDGEPRRITSGSGDSDPLFSPDGQRVLFRRELPPDPGDLPRFALWVVEIDSGDEWELVNPEDLPGETGTLPGEDAEVRLYRLPLQTAWLPGGQTIAFNTQTEFGLGLDHNDDLWLVDVESASLTRLLEDGEGGAFAFSPDGTRLVTATPTDVTMMMADGTDRRTLVIFEFVNTASEYAYRPMPVWKPDGSYALVAISSREPFGPEAGANVWQLPLSGEATLVQSLRGDFLFSSMEGSLWSPDRTRIGYTLESSGTDPNVRDLIVARWDGSESTVYATGRVGFLNWAPDNRRFSLWIEEPGDVYLGEAGVESLPLVPPEGGLPVHAPHWIDAHTLVYLIGGRGAFEIRLAPLPEAHPTLDVISGGYVQLDVYP
jgi:dipeptidyl aminopeptidase/acylaminoacyl peptidase